ncbi:hypothetical protein CHUUTOTORO_02230 [Serratia phage vB_SmaM-ChuuTotoro]|nr:hypothetical protein CHUUTOTORO_02230 [Serratia phage vB_SmaM-ChuuTotoro]
MNKFNISEHSFSFDADVIVSESGSLPGYALVEVFATSRLTGESSAAGIRLNYHQASVLGQELIRLAEELKK